MNSVLIVALLVGAAHAEPLKLAAPQLVAAAPPQRAHRDLTSMCNGVMSAAGFGVSGGKIVLVKRGASGRTEEIAATVGRARLVPAFDVSLGGASALFRFVF